MVRKDGRMVGDTGGWTVNDEVSGGMNLRSKKGDKRAFFFFLMVVGRLKREQYKEVK